MRHNAQPPPFTRFHFNPNEGCGYCSAACQPLGKCNFILFFAILHEYIGPFPFAHSLTAATAGVIIKAFVVLTPELPALVDFFSGPVTLSFILWAMSGAPHVAQLHRYFVQSFHARLWRRLRHTTSHLAQSQPHLKCGICYNLSTMIFCPLQL